MNMMRDVRLPLSIDPPEAFFGTESSLVSAKIRK